MADSSSTTNTGLSFAGGSYTAPRFDTKDKNELYHKNFAQFIVNHSISDDWRNNYNLILECYKFVEEGSNGELLPHLQQAEDGTSLPAPWVSLNTIPTKVDLLVGEMETRGYDIRVRALNKEAISRKLEEKERLRVKRRLQPLFQTADEQVGFQTSQSEYIPQTEQELNEYIDLSFKDKAEIIMESALKWLAKKNGWDEERKALFRDILIAGRSFTKEEIIRGVPRSIRVHPLNMIFDTSCKKDDLSDSSYFGELDYLPLPSAVERFGLSNKEVEQVYNAYQEFLGMTAANEVVSAAASYTHDFGAIGGNRLKWFKMVDGELKVLVAKAAWRDYKTLNHKNEKKEPYGTEYLQKLPDDQAVRERDKDKIISKKIEIWRQCTIVGGCIVREWGECPNQARNLSDISTTEPPYRAWIPNYSTGRGVSKAEQLAQLQLLKDMVMYNMNVAMTRAGAKGMTYDLAMIPQGWTPEQVMKYMRVFGVNFINTKEYQLMNGNLNTFKEFDMTLSDSIAQYVEIMRFYESEMDKMSGVSPERQGVIQGASQGLGITQSALFQSNLITAPYFIGFERFNSRVLNQQAKLVKIAWANNEVFAPIIGDSGVDFLREHINLDLDEFGVFVESVPPIFQDRNKLEQLLMIVVQSDPTFVNDALAIMMEPDTRVAVRKFQRRTALKQALAAQQQQIAAEQEEALQQRLKAIDAQAQQQQIAGKLQETQMKNQAGIQKTAMTGRVKLADTKIKSLVDLQKEKYNEKTKTNSPKKG